MLGNDQAGGRGGEFAVDGDRVGNGTGKLEHGRDHIAETLGNVALFEEGSGHDIGESGGVFAGAAADDKAGWRCELG